MHPDLHLINLKLACLGQEEHSTLTVLEIGSLASPGFPMSLPDSAGEQVPSDTGLCPHRTPLTVKSRENYFPPHRPQADISC